jgi:solute carrier family 25 S-adenosylmethionine transporter 26
LTHCQAGLGVAVVGAMPSVGLYFGVYSYSKEKLLPLLRQYAEPSSDRAEETLRTISIASAAAIGNTIASFSRVPYEVVKQKLQTGEYSSTFIAMKDMFQTNGVRAFFPVGGISIQMIRYAFSILVLILSQVF